MDPDPRDFPKGLANRVPSWLLTILPAGIFLLALNPWFTPEQHDDVLYFFGAKSIAETGEFALDGTPITDWPPVFSLLLAGARVMAGESVWVAKFVVFAFVVGGMFAIRAVAKAHRFEFPTAVATLTCLLPISLICGASVLSEWPFLAISFAFLLALQHLGASRSIQWTIAAGALLAIASLTRFAGVFLGVAVVAQMWRQIRQTRSESKSAWYQSVAPEFAVAVIGAVPWLLWKVRCSRAIARGEAPSGAYDQPSHYFERFSNIDAFALSSKVEAVLLSLSRVVQSRIENVFLSGFIVAIFIAALTFGMIRRFTAHGVRPADWYVLAILALLLGDLVKPERYFLPIAPFLIGYMIFALREIAAVLANKRPSLLVKGAIALWAAWLITLDGYLLFVGNADNSRGGFSFLATRDIESFYKGRELDLYRAISFADAKAPAEEEIGSVGFHGKYVLAFTGRGFANFPEDELETVSYVVIRDGSDLGFQFDLKQWHLAKKLDAHSVYKRKKN